MEIDSGSGQSNAKFMACLRLQGILMLSEFPNTTSVG